MQQADVRVDALDHLAVQLQHEAQHAVRRGVLGPEVDVEVADFCFSASARGASGTLHRDAMVSACLTPSDDAFGRPT